MMVPPDGPQVERAVLINGLSSMSSYPLGGGTVQVDDAVGRDVVSVRLDERKSSE